MSRYDSLIKELLNEQEITKPERLAALKNLANSKVYKVLDITNSRGQDFLVSVKDLEATSLDEVINTVRQEEVDKVTAALQDEPNYLDKYLRDWVFTEICAEDDIGYVNTGEESCYVIIGRNSAYWRDSNSMYNSLVSPISHYINDKFFQ